MGAVAGGVRVLNKGIVSSLGIPDYVDDAVAAKEEELQRRERLYRGGRAAPDVRGRKVILVDDGLATGATMQAAIEAYRQLRPAKHRRRGSDGSCIDQFLRGYCPRASSGGKSASRTHAVVVSITQFFFCN